MDRPVLFCIEVPLRPDFTARLYIPLDLDLEEAGWLSVELGHHVGNRLSALNFPVCEPDLFPEITL